MIKKKKKRERKEFSTLVDNIKKEKRENVNNFQKKLI